MGLASLEGLRQLRSLNLASCVAITEKGLAAVASLPQLGTLSIGGCSRVATVTNAAMQAIRPLSRLTHLDLSGCLEVTDAGPPSPPLGGCIFNCLFTCLQSRESCHGQVIVIEAFSPCDHHHVRTMCEAANMRRCAERGELPSFPHGFCLLLRREEMRQTVFRAMQPMDGGPASVGRHIAVHWSETGTFAEQDQLATYTIMPK